MTRSGHPDSPARHHRGFASALAATVLVLAVAGAVLAISPPAARALGLGPDASASATSTTPAPEQWVWPAPAPIRVVSPFRAPPTPYTSGHRGIDLEVAPGAALVAAEGGTVSFAGMVAGRGVVAIDHGDGVVSAIEPVSPIVEEGAVVVPGEPIGTASQGGHCDGGCVHFGVRVDGEYVSPFLFLGGLPRAVLLPY